MAGAAIPALAAFAIAIARGSLAVGAGAVLFSAIAAWVAYFFRDPERTGERGAHLVVAPADGIVLPVVPTDETTFVRGKALRISIFMNIFDVHVNRYPVDGVVRHVHYNAGKFLHAASDKASLENEQRSIGIDTGAHRVLVRQIAGLIARRVVTYSQVGDRVTQGSRMGIIRFGSRVDVFVPDGSRLRVQSGERVYAGTTIIAEFAA
jgi:phosphatidylserine decarboxylase